MASSYREIIEEDLEPVSIVTCRICFQCEGEEDEDLISPCMCKGTHQFVHRSCLDHWRSLKGGFDFSHCTICKAQFHLQVTEIEEVKSWRQKKFRLFVARDVVFVFLALQTVIGMLGGLAYIADKNGSLRYLCDDSPDRILSRPPISFYYCIGVLVFFVLFGFFGIIIHCCRCSNNDRRNCCNFCIGSCPFSAGGCPRSSRTSLLVTNPYLALIITFMAVFVFIGIVYGLFVATIIIQRIWQRHYHILAKKELTQEYVVEDLNGCYTPPKLDPELMERLKKLKLV